MPKEAFLEDIEISLPNNVSRSITLITTVFADREEPKVLKRKRDSDITSINPIYLPSRL